MRNSLRFVCAVIAIVFSASTADAQFGIGNYPDPSGGPLCPDIVNGWIANAQRVRQLGGCGLNLNDPSLSLDRRVQADLCLSMDEGTAANRTSELRHQAA